MDYKCDECKKPESEVGDLIHGRLANGCDYQFCKNCRTKYGETLTKLSVSELELARGTQEELIQKFETEYYKNQDLRRKEMMNGQNMQLKQPCEEACESVSKIQSMTEETNDIFRLSKDIKELIEKIRTRLFGLYPDEVDNLKQEPCSINEYIDQSKRVLIDALEELYRLKDRL